MPQGRHAAGAIELKAPLCVAEGKAGMVPMVTDCNYKWAGAAPRVRLYNWAAVQYLQGGNGDLWERVLVVLPRVRGVPAHRNAPGGGLSKTD